MMSKIKTVKGVKRPPRRATVCMGTRVCKCDYVINRRSRLIDPEIAVCHQLQYVLVELLMETFLLLQ